ncbi:MAG: FAD-dependent oxidoreductase [Alphaproteobacteria bacterium]|nr:FAD-dependent oxidoreductase [Alphaproteobacteria bacterium]
MSEVRNVDICVIGAGSGGLSVAAGAVQMGASVALFERGKMGGDCLNYGCVPSKALLAAGHAAAHHGATSEFGVNAAGVEVDFAGVNDHVHDVIAGIAPHDSVERFEGLGVEVYQEGARFTGPREVVGDNGTRVRARRFVVATGSSPAVPPIPGLDEVDFLTNESVFNLRECPEHLVIIGGGPIGLEMAQAHRRLGAKVTVLEAMKIMGPDDRDLVAIVRARLAADGVAIEEGAQVTGVRRAEGGVTVMCERDGGTFEVNGSHLLVAVGRSPNLSSLDLDAAGIAYDRKGIEVDDRLRTTNRKVFAVGDVAGKYQFTHIAGYHAGIVIRNVLFRLPAKVDYNAVPWVTYTDPELANVGLTEAAAREQHGDDVQVVTAEFAENDRARTERRTEGMVKAVVGKRGRILGAGVVGPHAGEIIQPWILAVSQKMKIGAMAQMIVPYPTLGELNKRAAGAYYTPSLFSERTRKIVRLLAKLG